MMAPDFLTQIRASGLSVKLDGDRLQVWPGSRLTPELSETIRTHKPDIVEALGVASWCWWLAFSESEHLSPTTTHRPAVPKCWRSIPAPWWRNRSSRLVADWGLRANGGS